MVTDKTCEYYIERSMVKLSENRVKTLKRSINVVGFNYEYRKETKVAYPAVLVNCQPYVERAPGARFGKVVMTLSVRTHITSDENRNILQKISSKIFQVLDKNVLNQNFSDLPDNYLRIDGIVESDSDSGIPSEADCYEKTKTYDVFVSTNLN